MGTSLRDDLELFAKGWRWGKRPLAPETARPSQPKRTVLASRAPNTVNRGLSLRRVGISTDWLRPCLQRWLRCRATLGLPSPDSSPVERGS